MNNDIVRLFRLPQLNLLSHVIADSLYRYMHPPPVALPPLLTSIRQRILEKEPFLDKTLRTDLLPDPKKIRNQPSSKLNCVEAGKRRDLVDTGIPPICP